jgi:hypothetical protein
MRLAEILFQLSKPDSSHEVLTLFGGQLFEQQWGSAIHLYLIVTEVNNLDTITVPFYNIYVCASW